MAKVELRDAKFKRSVWLIGLTFRGKVDLSSTVFHGGLFIKDCIFEHDISFYEALFHDYVIFTNVRIGGFAQFRNGVFNRGAVFRDVLFDSDARFRRCRFWDRVEFDDSHFSRRANFFSTVFGNDVSFRNTTFGSTVSFGHSTYYRDADFSCSGAGKSDDSGSKRFEVREFNASIFGGRAIFNNRSFTEPTNFRKTIFNQAPEFHGAALHQGMIFPSGGAFRDTRSVEAAKAYRTLKLGMESVRARDEEGVFFALEQRSLRRSGGLPQHLTILSLLYDFISAYGQSILRPLIWLAATTAIFAWYYSGTLSPSRSSAFSGAGIEFALQQVFRPFGIWWTIPESSYKVGLSQKLFATVQSLMSLSLITLFLLALRRRFKLD